MKKFNDGRDWFFEKRFGLFIHWGIYSIGGIHEQELWRCEWNPDEYYRKYMPLFNPLKFDPVQWLDFAEENNVEYITFTTKHHDGFCMWDTKETDCNIMNTPYGKDIFGMLANECHRRNIPLCAYYSVVDWHHPAYPNTGTHSHEIITDPVYHNVEEYINFVKRQIQEICTNYGPIHGIWWDLNSSELKDPSVAEMIRKLQPQAVLGERGFSEGDFFSRECIDGPELPYFKPTEACNTVTPRCWGYNSDEYYHTPQFLMGDVARNIALGGNYLLNIGPKPDGTFATDAKKIFSVVGSWYGRMREALTAIPVANVTANKNYIFTVKDKSLFVIMPTPPESLFINLGPFAVKPIAAELLNTSEKLSFKVEPIFSLKTSDFSMPELKLKLPFGKIPNEPLVIKLEFNDDVNNLLAEYTIKT